MKTRKKFKGTMMIPSIEWLLPFHKGLSQMFLHLTLPQLCTVGLINIPLSQVWKLNLKH